MINKFLLGWVVVIGLVWAHQAECQKSYDGFAVYRCRPEDTKQLHHLRELMGDQTNEHVKFWSEPNAINGTVDIMVAPSEQKKIRTQLVDWHIHTEEVLADVGTAIQKTLEIKPVTRAQGGQRQTDNYFAQYQPYSRLEARLQQIGRNPGLTVQTVGRSHEGRNIHMVKISADPGANKPVIFIDALHHAREWVSASTAMYLIDYLSASTQSAGTAGRRILRGRNGHQSVKPRQSLSAVDVLQQYDFWIVPTVNPDGYEYTRSHDRLWRKTRSPQSGCMGADPNRNYGFHWRESGASSQPCSEIYAGPQAFSEVEARVISGLLDSNKNRIAMYISLHAFSQVILSPYGFARTYPPNFEELKRVANIGAAEIAKYRGTDYRFGTAAILMYPAAGGSDDYAFGKVGIPYSYTIELPDKGSYGFLLPPSEIIPVGEETAMGIVAMARSIQANRRKGRG